MEFVETPEARFSPLHDFPYFPKFAVVDPRGLRMAYIDEGPRDAPPILMLHGEPSWSYLYRSMIAPCLAAGHRVVAPDMIGFGRSSKPTQLEDYSYQGHVAWLVALLESLDLRDVTLFAQDWGSLIGLRVAAEHGERFARIAIGNGFLPEGAVPKGTRGALNAGAFLAWRAFATYSPWFPISSIVSFGTARGLSAAERAAYDAPFPSPQHCAGARAFPRLVPIEPWNVATADNRRAWSVLERWQKPFLTLFSDGDPITRGLDRSLQRRIPGAAGQPHARVHGGHFLQEDAGAELAARLNAFVAAAANPR
ncbi:MAG TPA: haloalkane dehalogenase [Polyangiales bacterium]